MRVLYIISNPSLHSRRNTGYARHIRETINQLRVNGHEIEVFQSSELDDVKNQSVSSAEIRPSSIKRMLKSFVPSVIWESIKDVFLIIKLKKARIRLNRYVDSRAFDVLIERASYLSSLGESVKRKFDLPFIIELNAPLVEEQVALNGKSLLNPLARRIEKRIYSSSSAVITVSGALANYVHDLGIVKDKIVVNHNGVSEEDFSLTRKDQVGKTIGFIGSIMPYHGIDYLLEASANLHHSGLEHSILIVGDGESLDQYKSMAKDLGISDVVRFTGGVPYQDISSYLSLMDICVLPSTEWYCSPIKLFEYGLMGKAVIASDHACVHEIIENERTGWIVSDVEEMTYAMRVLLEDISKRQRLGLAFRNKVISSFLWRHNGQRLDEVIKRVVVDQT